MRNEDVTNCSLCGEPLVPRGPVVGFKVTTQRLAINVQNARSFAGLAMHFSGAGARGAHALANVFAPGDVIDEPAALRDEFIVCESCSDRTILPMLEDVHERKENDRDEDRMD